MQPPSMGPRRLRPGGQALEVAVAHSARRGNRKCVSDRPVFRAGDAGLLDDLGAGEAAVATDLVGDVRQGLSLWGTGAAARSDQRCRPVAHCAPSCSQTAAPWVRVQKWHSLPDNTDIAISSRSPGAADDGRRSNTSARAIIEAAVSGSESIGPTRLVRTSGSAKCRIVRRRAPGLRAGPLHCQSERGRRSNIEGRSSTIALGPLPVTARTA